MNQKFNKASYLLDKGEYDDSYPREIALNDMEDNMRIFGIFKKKAKEQKPQFSHDKVERQWESALEEYCNRNGVKEEELNLDELEEEVEATIWEYAENHI